MVWLGKGLNKEADILSSVLIRLAGLATMVGGVGSFAIIWVSDWLSLLLLGAMIVPALAVLGALHRERFGWAATLIPLTVFVGLVLVIASWVLELKSVVFLDLGLEGV
jgi:hypothetical protein